METVAQQLEKENPRLLGKFVLNPDLCNFILALLAKVVWISMQRGFPRNGVTIDPAVSSDLPNQDIVFRARVRFGQVAVGPPARWPLQSDFARYTRAKAYGLGLALQENPKLCEFFQTLLESIDRFARYNGIPFRTLKVQKAIISTGDIVVLQVGRNVITH